MERGGGHVSHFLWTIFVTVAAFTWVAAAAVIRGGFGGIFLRVVLIVVLAVLGGVVEAAVVDSTKLFCEAT